MRIKCLLLCAVSALPLLAGCNGHGWPDQQTYIRTLDDSGTNLMGNGGDRLLLVLPATAGTNYSWQVVGGSTDMVHLEQEKAVLPSGGGAVGQAGFEAMTFVLSGSGVTVLSLEYRPVGSASGTQPANTFSITIDMD